jgi:hypothetical protein
MTGNWHPAPTARHAEKFVGEGRRGALREWPAHSIKTAALPLVLLRSRYSTVVDIYKCLMGETFKPRKTALNVSWVRPRRHFLQCF